MPLLTCTSRLKIRKLTPADINSFYEYRSNPEIAYYQGFDVMTMAESEDFINQQMEVSFGRADEWAQFGIDLAETKTLIGDCAIKLSAGALPAAEVGITISQHYQKQGFAKEAIVGLIKFLFGNMAVKQAVAIADTENTASINLLKSAGFRLDTSFTNTVFLKGRESREYRFVIDREYWQS